MYAEETGSRNTKKTLKGLQRSQETYDPTERGARVSVVAVPHSNHEPRTEDLKTGHCASAAYGKANTAPGTIRVFTRRGGVWCIYVCVLRANHESVTKRTTPGAHYRRPKSRHRRANISRYANFFAQRIERVRSIAVVGAVRHAVSPTSPPPSNSESIIKMPAKNQ